MQYGMEMCPKCLVITDKIIIVILRQRLVINMYLLWMIILALNSGSYAETQTYAMEEYCGGEISMILDSVYQLKLQLDDNFIHERMYQSNKRPSCQVKLEATYTWPKLMFYFENLDLDCDHGYIQFFQNENFVTRVKGLEDDLCGDKAPKGVFTVDSESYLKIKYIPKRRQYIEDVFSIIVTSYANGQEIIDCRVEVGRWRQSYVPLEDRKCPPCLLNDLGDEFHYLLKCPFFLAARIQYIPRIYYARPNVLTFHELLSTDNIKLLRNVSVFTSQMIKITLKQLANM